MTIHEWLTANGYGADLEALAAAEPLQVVADEIQSIIESEAPELAQGGNWLALAAGYAFPGDAVTIVADTINGIAVVNLADLLPAEEYIEPDDFITALAQVQDDESIATTFAADDERLAWIEAEYGIHGWRPA